MDEHEVSEESSENLLGDGDPKLENKESMPDESEDLDSKSKGMSGRDGDAFVWLEGPDFGATVEELPTLRWPNDATSEDGAHVLEAGPQARDSAPLAAERPTDDVEDAMLWLERLAAGQGTPIDDMPTLVTIPPLGDESTGDLGDRAPEPAVDLEQAPGEPRSGDSDPMAWLEQLAADQDSPLEELPSVADRLLASEIASQTEAIEGADGNVADTQPISAEVNEALTYLERLAIAQGVSLDGVSLEDYEPVGSLEEALRVIDGLADRDAGLQALTMEEDLFPPEASQEELATLEPGDEWTGLAEDMPEDPDEVFAWLGALAGDGSEPEVEESGHSAGAIVAGATAAAAAMRTEREPAESELEPGGDKPPLDARFLEDMPEDPDEAMAWMKDLALKEPGPAPARPEPRQQEDPGLDSVSKIATAAAAVQHSPALEPESLEQPEQVDDLAPAPDQAITDDNPERLQQALEDGNVDLLAEAAQAILESGEGGRTLLSTLEKAVDLHPGDARLWQLLGDGYMQEGKLQKAKAAYQRAIAL